MKHRTLVFILLALISSSLTLSACGKATSTTTTLTATSGTPTATLTPTATPLSGPVTLTLWATGTENDAAPLRAAAVLFHSQNPLVTVSVKAIPPDSAHSKIVAALTTGTSDIPPDIITGDISWAHELGTVGGLIDLKAVYSDVYNEISALSLPDVLLNSIGTPAGEVYAVPWTVDTYLFYYRTDLVATAPKNWDELTAEIKKQQTAGNKGFEIEWGNLEWQSYLNFLYAAGGTLYDESCSKATVNGAEGVQALKYLAELYTKYKAPTDAAPALGSGLNDGSFPMGMTAASTAGGLDAAYPGLSGKWSVAPLPNGPANKDTAFVDGKIIGVASTSKLPDLAAKFIRFLYTPEAMASIIAKFAAVGKFYIPPSVAFIDLIPAPAFITEAIKIQLNSVAGPPNCSGWAEKSVTLQDQIVKVIKLGADPQTALDVAAADMDEGLKG
jgi:multiple sugar transport system substrate-binding protein